MHRTKGQLFILALVYVYTIAKHRVPCLMLNRTWDDWSEAVSGQQPPRSDVVLFAVCLTGSTRDYQIGFFYFPSSFFSSLFFFFTNLSLSLSVSISNWLKFNRGGRRKKKARKFYLIDFFQIKSLQRLCQCASVCAKISMKYLILKKKIIYKVGEIVFIQFLFPSLRVSVRV